MLRVGDGIPDHILQEDFQHPPGLHVDEATDRGRKNIFWLVTNFFVMKLAVKFFGRNDNIFPSTQQSV